MFQNQSLSNLILVEKSLPIKKIGPPIVCGKGDVVSRLGEKGHNMINSGNNYEQNF